MTILVRMRFRRWGRRLSLMNRVGHEICGSLITPYLRGFRNRLRDFPSSGETCNLECGDDGEMKKTALSKMMAVLESSRSLRSWMTVSYAFGLIQPLFD